jgi:O-antigen ligase
MRRLLKLKLLEYLFCSKNGSSSHKVFIITALYYSLLIFNLNNKTLIVLSVFLFGCYYLTTKDLHISVFFVFVVNSVILVGKTYIFQLIPPEEILSESYQFGRRLNFIISIKDIFAFVMAFIIFKDKIKFGKKFKLKITPAIFYLSLYYFLALCSLVRNSLMPDFSILLWLQSLEILILLFYWNIYLKGKKKVGLSLAAIFSSLLIFEAGLSLGQFVKSSPIGLSIEIRQEIFNQATDISTLFFRPMGTFHHPNELANFVLPISILLTSLLYSRVIKKIGWVVVPSLIAGAFILIFAASRSAWLGLFIGIFFVIFVYERLLKIKIKLKGTDKVKKFLLAISPILLLGGVIVGLRFIRSIYSFGRQGAFYSRQQLTKEALVLIEKHPVWGVGYGMNIVAAFRQNVTGVMKFFPETVHNGFLTIISESGIATFLVFLVFIYRILKNIINKLNLSPGEECCIIKVAQLGAVIAITVNMFFQPVAGYYAYLLILVNIYFDENI